MESRKNIRYEYIFFALLHSRTFRKKQVTLPMELRPDAAPKEAAPAQRQPSGRPLWDNPWQLQGGRPNGLGMRISIDAAGQNPWMSLLNQQEIRKQRRHNA